MARLLRGFDIIIDAHARRTVPADSACQPCGNAESARATSDRGDPDDKLVIQTDPAIQKSCRTVHPNVDDAGIPHRSASSCGGFVMSLLESNFRRVASENADASWRPSRVAAEAAVRTLIAWAGADPTPGGTGRAACREKVGP